ncbi:Gp49 family protein [Microvirgula aerodenitrificans]|uniref:Gp49 family protein n=1 Tax=Microvirgula aerodenitrificans TaxID=57480 RepID=UPI000A06C564|nr:Gp49 family protein [Microvirgula aerodenitrificans]
MNDQQIEQEIQAKGLTAPRITPADIESNIDTEIYFTADHGIEGALAKMELHARHQGGGHVGSLRLLTFCVLVLKNGFTVTGESACASPENFDTELGRKIARENAIAKVWPLMGYELRTQLSRPVLTEADAIADLNGIPRPAAAA